MLDPTKHNIVETLKLLAQHMGLGSLQSMSIPGPHCSSSPQHRPRNYVKPVTEEEMVAQRGAGSCLRSHSKEEAELGFESRTLALSMVPGVGTFLPWDRKREGVREGAGTSP